jgi:hypothetical protein
MLPNPKHPLGPVEKLAYAERHPITGYSLERGYGAQSPDEQARNLHLPLIEQTEGKSAAAAMRIKLGLAKAPPLKLVPGSERGGG